jgi:cell division protein FtsA
MLGSLPKAPVLPEEEEDKRGRKTPGSDDIDLTHLGLSEEMKSVSKKTLIEGIIRPRLNEIFTMVGLEIKRSGFGGMTPSGVVITGGGALTVGSVEAARRNLAMPVHIGMPTRVSGLIDEIMTPGFTTSVGLLLWGGQLSRSEQGTSSASRFGQRVAMKGIAGKVLDLVKSFLP